MARMALRPALRAYAHAPAGAADWTPADLTGIILWLDPSESGSNRITSGSDVTTLTDKIAAKDFTGTFPYGTYTDSATGSLGNGLEFLKTSPSVYSIRTLTFTPVGAPYNDTDTGGAETDWTSWAVYYFGTGGTSVSINGLMRGRFFHTPGCFDTLTPTSVRGMGRGNWVDSNVFLPFWYTSSSPGYVSNEGRAQLLILQNKQIDGAWKLLLSQDGTDWFNGGTAPEPPASAIPGTENVWSIILRNWDPGADVGMGEMGFISGAIDDSELQTLHTYLKDKWDLHT